jgi:hypothetical protein
MVSNLAIDDANDDEDSDEESNQGNHKYNESHKPHNNKTVTTHDCVTAMHFSLLI